MAATDAILKGLLAERSKVKSDPPQAPEQQNPQHRKLLALQLPIKTITEFLSWLKRRYPDVPVGEIDATSALYEYYSIDLRELEEERKRLKDGGR